MTNLRRKRLLLLARQPSGSHQYFYGQYCKLIGEGLVSWCLGTAFITEEGEQWLKNNKNS